MSLVGNVGEDGHRMGSDRGGGLHPSLYFYSLTLTKSESLVDLTGKTKRCSVNLVRYLWGAEKLFSNWWNF